MSNGAWIRSVADFLRRRPAPPKEAIAVPRQGGWYRNQSGIMLYGFIPPDGLVELRNIRIDDRAFPGSAFQGDVVIEWDPGDNSGILRSIAIPMEELTMNFSAVED